jgi:hypothetical protein
VNAASLFRAVDSLIAFRDAVRRFKGTAPPPPDPAQVPVAAPGLAGQIEARLANVVVAALKEAFDRDHARLELERTQLEEQRRRAEAALQAELRRQAADRELARLRLLGGASMVGWIASVAIVAAGLAGASLTARMVLAVGWVLLLAALGATFMAQRAIGLASAQTAQSAGGTAAGTASLWLLIAGLAATAVSLLF